MKDFSLLLRSTLRLYKESLLEAGKAFLLFLWVPLLYVVYLFVFALGAFISSFLGPFLGGFFLFGVSTLLLSHMLSAVEVSLKGRKLKFKNALSLFWMGCSPIFLNLVSVFFAIFILTFLVRFTPAAGVASLVISFLFGVLGNPLIELSYQGRGSNYELFAESFAFIRESFLEWFFPLLLLIAFALVLLGAPSLRETLVLAFGQNPLYLLQSLGALVLAFWHMGLFDSLVGSATLVLLAYLVFFILLFRGALFAKLARSTRRKRIYQEKGF